MQPHTQVRTAEECRALQAEIRELRITVDNRKQENTARGESIRQLILSVNNHRTQIDALTRNEAAATSGYQQCIDGLRTTIEGKDGAIGDLHEEVRILNVKVDSDTNLIQNYQREQDEATDSIIALQAQMIEQHERIQRYADDNAVLSQHVRERDATDVERERVERECIDYIYQNDGTEVCDIQLGDIHRAKDTLAPQVAISYQVVGSVIWVSATWGTPPNTDDNDDDAPSITLRIELDPIGYNTSRLPPTFKITQGGEEFPVGHRIVHMMRLYMGRCWGRGGFNPPPATTTPTTVQPHQPTTASYLFDTDPRCVAPYVAQEGGLVAHLVRYAMLRMETYTDFCVVCDAPIQHNREYVVICDRAQCDYSFHEKGVGYASVGVERTAGTASGLHETQLCNHSNYVAGELQTIFMMTHIVSILPRHTHHPAVICSAGSKGYCAVKEMLQNGVPGNTLLIESDDLRNIESSTKECCLIFSNENSYSDPILPMVEHVVLYSNCVCLPPFLLNSASITSLDLSPLSQVRNIPPSFFAGCSGLTTLDLSPLSWVSDIPPSFLEGCSGLTTLDLSPLSWVTEIPSSFLEGCSGLTTLDLSPLSQVTEVQQSFLERCSNLDVVGNPPPSCTPPPIGWVATICTTTGIPQWVRKE